MTTAEGFLVPRITHVADYTWHAIAGIRFDKSPFWAQTPGQDEREGTTR